MQKYIYSTKGQKNWIPIHLPSKISFFGMLYFFLFLGFSAQAQESWNIQLEQSFLDCSANQVCYEVELQSAPGGNWTLGDQNYRFFFDGDLMTVTTVTSLLPSNFYGLAIIGENLKFSGQGQEVFSPLDSIDSNLGFLDFNIVQTDKSNPPSATQIAGTFVPIAEICIDVDPSVMNDPMGNTCLSLYHSRPSTAGAFSSQYTVISENDAPNSTISTTGVGYNDLTPDDGADACLGLSCGPCATSGGDSDNDGVCDNNDCAPLNPNLPAIPGTTCNDNDPTTVNDVYLADGCTCEGTFDSCATSGGDSDNDGVCDDNDCAPLNANLPAPQGTACNDNNPNTINDVYLADGCTCEGTFDPCATSGGDSDNDGVCNNNDCAPLNPNLPAPQGTACNDNNPNTINDVYLADGCTCEGTFDPCAVAGGDSDNDGVCDDNDCAPLNANLPAPQGTPCNDGNPNTVNDMILADECTCNGMFEPCTTLGGDSDNDGTCDNDDCAPLNPNLPTTPGTTCNDNNSNTVNDQIQADGCTCAGTFDPCATSGGDTDNDGICNDNDCSPLNPNLPTTPGTPCGDGDPNTINDVVQADGCTCAGTFEPCATAGGDSDNDGICDDDDCAPNNSNLPTTPGTACDDGNANTVNDIIKADGCSCLGTPQMIDCNNISITSIPNAIVVSELDGAPISSLQIFNSQWQQDFSCFADCNATETVSVIPGTYNVYAKYYDANYNLICQKIQSITVANGGGGCDNVINGGQIGFGNNCTNSSEICGASGTAATIVNCLGATGGAGSLEYVWLKNEVNCVAPTVTVSEISMNPNSSDWEIITGANGPSYNPGTVSTNTCYTRCARRSACEEYEGESNIVSIDVDPNCGNGTPDCADISITPGNGTITVSGLDGAPISSLQIFNSQWQQEFSCFADCNATETVSVIPGTYHVYAKYYTAAYQLICQEVQTIVVTGGGCTDNDNDGVCVANDCDDNNPNVPAIVGSSCNDGNNATVNDVIQSDGCSCAGIINDPCANAGGDADNDGICANNDCDDNNPNVPTNPGTACNDGDSNTTNDVIQSDGCSCAGTPVGGGTPDCNDISITTGSGTIVVSGLDGAPVSSLQIFNSQWQQEFSCFADCNATETVSVIPGTYHVYAKYYTAGYAFICQENQTVTVTGGGNACDNLTDGGEIGFGVHCDTSMDYCPGSGAVSQIESCVLPSGGSGTIEYIWLKSTTTSTPPMGTVINNQNWDVIAGATQAEYLPTNVSETTYFIRCARRASCVNYTGGSNIVRVLVDPNCGNGGGTTDPNCADVTITASSGNIIVTGLDGAPVTSVQIFNSAWQTEFACFDNCDSPTQSVPVSDGIHYVYVKYYTAAYSLVCTVEKPLDVINGMALISNDNGTTSGFDFQVNKWAEHSEVMWAHTEGHLVTTYTLERSANGQNFTGISEIASKGTALTESYQSYDIEPMMGDNHYRIKMDYVDGIVVYSAIQKVHFADVIDFTLFPNPANRFVKVNLEDALGQEVDIKIYNNLGQELKAIHLEEIYNRYYQMDLQGLKEGHYTVWLSVPGRRAIAKKLVIGRM
jgi:hypothetical protein